MRKRSIFITLVYMFFCALGIQLHAENKEKRPNIILMMADDLGWGDTGFNGNTIIKTPHLDKMAEEGVVLSHFYSVGPVCSPTRASFLTGRHYYRMGVFTANKGHLPNEEFTIARMLKNEGYVTGHFGKWHLGTLSKEISAKGPKRKPELNFAPPWQRDYDESFVTESAVCTWDPGIGPRAVNNPYYHNGAPVKDPVKENVMGDDSRVIMDRVIPFMHSAVKKDKPFVVVIWFHAPHEDIKAGPEYLKMYQEYGEAAHYYGCITAMDEQIGRLRAELSALGIDDNTALFFCSDNGPEGPVPLDRKKTRRAGLAGEFRGRKRDVTEGGVRVPALALWPGHFPSGVRCDVPVSVLDYLPTVAQMTGACLPDDLILDGQNALPIIQQKTKVHEKAIPFRYNNKKGSFACLVKGKYKLIIQSKTNNSKDELYDLSSDTKELDNVVAEHPELVKEMREEILNFLKSAQKSHAGGDYNSGNYKPVDPWLELGEGTPKGELK